MIRKIAAAITFMAFVAAYIPGTLAADKNPTAASPLNQSLEKLKTDISSYFIAVTGDVISVDGDMVTINKGTGAAIRTGMRLTSFKEGATFTHPVTKEYLGKMEMPVGTIEISSVGAASSKGRIVSGKAADFADAKVKIAGKKIRILYYQGNVDWNLGDSYFRILLDSGRFELIDTGLQSAGNAEIVAEAKKEGAEVILALSSEELKNTIEITQKLYWVNDGKLFSDSRTSVALASVKQLKFSAGAFAWRQGEALLTYKIPFSAKRMAVGDFRGVGQLDIVFASDTHIGIYKLDVDLKPLWEFNVPGSGEILWIDTLDVNKDGRDEILVTTATGVKSALMAYSTDDTAAMRPGADKGGTVRSFIFSLQDDKFKPIWKGENMFIRALEKNVVAQEFSNADGFEGQLYPLEFNNGRFTKGKPVFIKKGLNIYDFQYVYAPDGRRGYFAWDESGFVNFFNDKGVRTWVSKDEFGGFQDSYKKESRNVVLDKGNWTMKDKFVTANAEVLAVKRNPMFGFVSIKSLGYSSSELRSFWWNGITVEERSYLEQVDGTIVDYVVIGDRLLVLVKPYLLSFDTAKVLLKGENPAAMMLYLFSTKGR